MHATLRLSSSPDIDPLVFSLLRDLFSFPILYALAVLFEGVQPIKSLKDGLVIAVLGLVCMCLGQVQSCADCVSFLLTISCCTSMG